MKAMKTLRAVLAGSVILAMTSVQAADANKKLASSKDWSLWSNGPAGSEVCYIQGAGENDWYFVVSKKKNTPNSPLEIMIQMLSNDRGSTSASLETPGLASRMAFGDINGKKMSFMGIPKNLSAVISAMRANTKVKLHGVGGKKEEIVEISSKGFGDMLNKLQEVCNGNAPIVVPEFENNFVNAVADVVDPLKLDMAKITAERSLYFAAYPIAIDLTNARGELSQILVKYQPSIDELNSNRASADQLSKTAIPNAKANLANNQATQKNSQAEIARVDAALPALTAKVSASQKALDAARAIIAPLQPEYDRLTGNLSSAQSTLDSSTNRLSYIDTRLRDGANQISSLDNEATNIERNLPQKRADLDRARSIYRDADNQRASYNTSFERDRLLRQNFEYIRLQNDRQRLQNDLGRAQNDAQNIRNERDRVQRDLQICQSSPIMEQELIPGGPLVPGPSEPPGGNDPGGPLVPGPSDPPPGVDPGPQQPVPVKDCSQLQNALNNANAQVNQADNQVRNISNQLDNTQQGIRRAEQQADFEVQRQYQMLADRADQARRDQDRIQNSVNDDENRRAQIRQGDIPRLQLEQSNLTNERPSVVQLISDSRSAVSRNAAALAQFKSANDYDRKAAAVDTKSNQLDLDQSALDTANASKSKSQADLQNALVAESQIKAQIDSLNSQLASLNARAVVLQDNLKGLPAERASVDAKIANLEVSLKGRKDQLIDLLK